MKFDQSGWGVVLKYYSFMPVQVMAYLFVYLFPFEYSVVYVPKSYQNLLFVFIEIPSDVWHESHLWLVTRSV